MLLKTRAAIDAEIAALEGVDVRRMLELGVWQGGSAVAWSVVLPLQRFVGIDIQSVDIPFPASVTAHPRWRTVTLHGFVSQDDASMLRQIVEEDLDGRLDLVVDDASHQYELSKASFESCFRC